SAFGIWHLAFGIWHLALTSLDPKPIVGRDDERLADEAAAQEAGARERERDADVLRIGVDEFGGDLQPVRAVIARLDRLDDGHLHHLPPEAVRPFAQSRHV